METSRAPKDDEEETPAKRRFNQCSTVVGAIVGIVMLIVSIIAYSQMAGFVNDYTSIANSWTTQPVVGITFTASSCTGSDEGVFGQWPGLYPACDCSSKVAGSNSTSTDTTVCDQQQLSDNCVTRTSQYPNPIRLDPFPGQQMCLQRSAPTALARSQRADSCAATERVCGSLFCWPTSQPCPITDFILSQTSFTQAAAGADDPVTSVGSYFLYVKRGGRLNETTWPNSARLAGGFPPTGLPITDVSFQPNTPCSLNGCGYGGRTAEYQAMAQAYKAANPTFGYTLKPFGCDGGCKKPDVSNSVSPDGYDWRYERTLRSIPEQQLYAAANVPAAYQPAAGQYEWYLQYRSEIQWLNTCPETRAKVVDRNTDVQNVKNAQTALLVFGIISFIVLTLYFPCINAFGSPETKKKTKNANLACNVCIKVATLICTIVTVVVAYSTLSFWASINDFGGCGDPLSNETFKVLGDKFGELSYKNAITTAASGITGIVDIVVVILQRFT